MTQLRDAARELEPFLRLEADTLTVPDSETAAAIQSPKRAHRRNGN
jgi:hypothetical protein